MLPTAVPGQWLSQCLSTVWVLGLGHASLLWDSSRDSLFWGPPSALLRLSLNSTEVWASSYPILLYLSPSAGVRPALQPEGAPYLLLLPSPHPSPRKSLAWLTHLSVCVLKDLNWHRWYQGLGVRKLTVRWGLGLAHSLAGRHKGPYTE